ncbi:MAG: BatD family protein [Prevotellaceae bacterium]|nr:BatD family protein [Prevotellaceae bacterium]
MLAALAIMLCSAQLCAQNLQLEIQAPRVVTVGEMFRVTFVANGKVDHFFTPNIEGFVVTAGPVRGDDTQVQIVNGKVTQSTTYSFTYTLYAEKEGKFTIGQAKVKAGNDEAQTQPFAIECVKGEQRAVQQGGSGGQQPAASAGGENSLYLGVTLSKTEVYRGEYLVAATKLYTRGNSIRNFENVKKPIYNGFWSQDIETPQEINFTRENVSGVVYDVGLLWKQLLFPQQSGELTISSNEIDVIMQVRTRSRDMFEDFFGGGYQNIRKSLQSKVLKVRVKELPGGAPASFSGAVGSFKIESSLSKKQLVANDATTLTVRISGNGNLKLMNAPKVDLPVDFEPYDTKTTDAIKNSDAGASGYRQFEIPFIPRSAGEFTIPPIEFSYFNPATGKYVTLLTQAHTISVEKDTKSQQTYASAEGRREGIKFLGKDIRFIKTGVTLAQQDRLFFGSMLFYLLYVALILVFAVLYVWLKKHRKNSQNVVLVRNRKANKVAKRRLKNSAQLLKVGNAQGFYDELLRAIWGYLSDKLNIPVSELSRENAREAFAERNIEEQYIETFISVIDECEFARYAPGSGRKEMTLLYHEAVGVISKLEQRVK